MNEEFKDALWEAIENVFYEFNGKRGERFGREDLEETIEDHARFFEEDNFDDFDDDEDFYNPEDDEDTLEDYNDTYGDDPELFGSI